MFRPAFVLGLIILACGGKTSTTGGLEVDVDYALLSPGDGCVRVEAFSANGKSGSVDVSLKNKPRAGIVKIGVAQAPDWASGVTLIGTLRAPDCSGAVVAEHHTDTMFPHGMPPTLTFILHEEQTDGGSGGGAGGGSAGGAAGGTSGGAAGGTSGGAGGGAAGGTAGGAAGGTAGGAAGGTAGGAAGGTAGGAAGGTAGGAAGGTAGGAASTGCDGGFLVLSNPLSGMMVDVAVVAPGQVWVAGQGGNYLARGGADAGFVAIASQCPIVPTGIWARPDGRCYVAGNDVRFYRVDNATQSCTQHETSSSGGFSAVCGFRAMAGLFSVSALRGSASVVDTHLDPAAGTIQTTTGATGLDDCEVIEATFGFSVGAENNMNARGTIVSAADPLNPVWSGPNNTRLHAVSIVNGNLAYAAGMQAAQVLRFDGGFWGTDLPSPGFEVWGLQAFSKSAVYAVGDSSQVKLWNGSMWKTVADFSGVTHLSRIRGTSQCDLWVVGENGLLATTNHR